MDNLLCAWKEFLKDKRNRFDVQKFSLNLADNILALNNELVKQNYRHGGYEAFKINDPKPRDIHKASVRDRLLHHAIYMILYPFFDKKFISDSFSCRLDKGTYKAINRFKSFYYKASKNKTRTCWVLKCDVRKFFANIDHKILMDILSENIEDQKLLRLFEEIICSFSSGKKGIGLPRYQNKRCISKNISNGVEAIIQTDCYKPEDYIKKEMEKSAFGSVRGLPLGNLTSQLFVNIYMDRFDQFVKHKLKAKYYIRYCDDFVIFSDRREHLENYFLQINKFLSEELKLQLHPNKVSIETIASGVDFLGWVNFTDHKVLRTKTKKRMFKRLEENEYKPESVSSYLGILSHGNAHKLENKLLNEK